ncbi:hypothetical protein RxyAA322_02210 [Rubrobacter xylanophilus]|uniref:non-specific serine/threonine protein kinase n=1 Tax=Rubrobacter xylanophilus TaxID=49319 RepID=A0A510HJ37_9ACTN|nr:protein kinase [Rubrobacter xylanophilus]BBL78367.1 hypothetical protein RxyAA322_02210 [Rubrobacter xylanophilus]
MEIADRTTVDGRYAVLGRLGGGGMAEVFLAHDRVLGREVALKVLREAYASDARFVERFRREARSVAALSHPNIVSIYDHGRTADGTYYIAMEHVPGGTLKERILKQAPLPPEEAAGTALQVARALGVAHGRGIVHRDIKPQNILLGSSGEAKVADFGIARAASEATISGTSLVLGTAGYMSPEQAMGRRAGARSDLYSLGVVLYEMLTGSLPYEADTPVAVAIRHIHEPPRHPRSVNPAVPAALDAVTVRLLAKRPEDRYPDAAALAEDLERFLSGDAPLEATRPLRPASPPAGRRRGTWRAIRGAVAAGALALLAAGAVWTAAVAPWWEDDAVRQAVRTPDASGPAGVPVQGAGEDRSSPDRDAGRVVVIPAAGESAPAGETPVPSGGEGELGAQDRLESQPTPRPAEPAAGEESAAGSRPDPAPQLAPQPVPQPAPDTPPSGGEIADQVLQEVGIED